VNEFHRFRFVLCTLLQFDPFLHHWWFAVYRRQTIKLNVLNDLNWFSLWLKQKKKKPKHHRCFFFHSFVTFFKSHQLIRSFNKRRSI
jgi:hypothetical protein